MAPFLTDGFRVCGRVTGRASENPVPFGVLANVNGIAFVNGVTITRLAGPTRHNIIFGLLRLRRISCPCAKRGESPRVC